MLTMRAVRVVRDIPLYVLGQRTGISAGRLSNIERELVVATPEERKKIAQHLRVKMHVLFTPATLESFMESQPQEMSYAAE